MTEEWWEWEWEWEWNKSFQLFIQVPNIPDFRLGFETYPEDFLQTDLMHCIHVQNPTDIFQATTWPQPLKLR